MNTFRKFMIGFWSIAILAIMYFRINYNDLSWKENSSSYIGIISALCFIVAMIGANRQENKKSKQII